MKTFLLFVKKPYADAIRDGRKTYEMRAGSKYRNVAPGDALSINGRMRLEITRVECHDSIDSVLRALRKTPFPLTNQDITECYPGVNSGFYVFHFKPPKEAALPRRPP